MVNGGLWISESINRDGLVLIIFPVSFHLYHGSHQPSTQAFSSRSTPLDLVRDDVTSPKFRAKSCEREEYAWVLGCVHTVFVKTRQSHLSGDYRAGFHCNYVNMQNTLTLRSCAPKLTVATRLPSQQQHSCVAV